MRTITRIRSVAAGLTSAVLALGLAACTPDDDPTDPPTTETTETVSSDDPTTTGESTEPTEAMTTREPPDIDPPTPPVEMGQDDPTGAAAAAYYFLELYPYLRTTGDTETWDSFVSAECDWCADVRAATVELHDAGGWIEDSSLAYDISVAEVGYPLPNEPYYTVELPELVERPYLAVQADGSAAEVAGRTYRPLIVGVQFENGEFSVVGVDLDEA